MFYNLGAILLPELFQFLQSFIFLFLHLIIVTESLRQLAYCAIPVTTEVVTQSSDTVSFMDYLVSLTKCPVSSVFGYFSFMGSILISVINHVMFN